MCITDRTTPEPITFGPGHFVEIPCAPVHVMARIDKLPRNINGAYVRLEPRQQDLIEVDLGVFRLKLLERGARAVGLAPKVHRAPKPQDTKLHPAIARSQAIKEWFAKVKGDPSIAKEAELRALEILGEP